MERAIVRTPVETENIDRSFNFARICVRKLLVEGYAPFSALLLYGQEGLLDFTKAGDQNLASMAMISWKAAANFLITFPQIENPNHSERFTGLFRENSKLERVIVESPYAGDIEANVNYARACARECLEKDEAPFLSHLLYTQPGILRDEVPEERQWGIDAGLVWGEVAQKTVVYQDLGMSNGMKYGIKNAERAGRPIEYRNLGEHKLGHSR